MASYSSSNYSNGYYDLSGIYFNPVSSSSTSSIDITTLDERYLKLSGGTISNNLIVSNSLDVQTSLTLPTIGNVETEIQAKQDILSSSSDITTGTISSGNITIRSGSILSSPNYTISGTPTETSHAINKGYVDDVLTIQTDLISNLETNKQDVINDGDLSIAKTNNLQTSLTALQSNIDLKQDTITTGSSLSLTGISTTGGAILNGPTYLNGTTIATGNLQVSTISGPNYTISGTPSDTTHAINKGYVDTALDTKQDDITSTTRLTLNGITAGFIVVGDAIDVEEKFDAIDATTTTNTNGLTSIQTQVDALINFTGGGVNFRAYTLSASNISAGNNLPYDTESYDTENSYNNTTYVYTIVIGGTYIFSLGWYVVDGNTAEINLIRKRSGVETIIQQSTNGTNTSNNSGYNLTTISECETGDEVFAYLSSGICRLIPFGITEPTNITSFSGSRISN